MYIYMYIYIYIYIYKVFIFMCILNIYIYIYIYIYVNMHKHKIMNVKLIQFKEKILKIHVCIAAYVKNCNIYIYIYKVIKQGMHAYVSQSSRNNRHVRCSYMHTKKTFVVSSSCITLYCIWCRILFYDFCAKFMAVMEK